MNNPESGLAKTHKMFQLLGYTFHKDKNPRHPETPAIRSAGFSYKMKDAVKKSRLLIKPREEYVEREMKLEQSNLQENIAHHI